MCYASIVSVYYFYMSDEKHNHHGRQRNTSHANLTYFLGFIGSLVYYVQQADGFWRILVAFLKACVWPAFLVYDVLTFVT